MKTTLTATVAGFDGKTKTVTLRMDDLPPLAIGDEMQVKLGKKRQPSSKAREIVAAFAEAYQVQYATPYRPTQKDGPSAELLAGWTTPDKLTETLERLWVQGGFIARRCVTVAKLAEHWNEAQAETAVKSGSVSKGFFG